MVELIPSTTGQVFQNDTDLITFCCVIILYYNGFLFFEQDVVYADV